MEGGNVLTAAKTCWNRKLVFSSMTACALLSACGDGDKSSGFAASTFGGRMEEIGDRLVELRNEMAELPVLPNEEALGSIGFHSDFTPEAEVNWFSIAWESSRKIDGIALFPVRLTSSGGEVANYGFPESLRIEAMLPGKEEPVELVVIKDGHLDFRKGEPVFLRFPATDVVSIRVIPTELRTLPGKEVRFFALSEIMVFTGDENVAPLGKLAARYSIDEEYGWNLSYLTDAQTPLGPPELPLPGNSLGWHSHSWTPSITDLPPIWVRVDLEERVMVEGVRIVAARGDSLIKGPGFGFPEKFRIEVSDSGDEGPWQSVWDSGDFRFRNPGYNPVAISFPPVDARFVRLLVETPHRLDKFTAMRVLLSEFEVIGKARNLALGKKVITSGTNETTKHDRKRVWSTDGLTDGYSSSGLLIAPRQWAEQLSLRFDLEMEQRDLLAEEAGIIRQKRLLVLSAAFLFLALVIAGLLYGLGKVRKGSKRRIFELRTRISSDLHDEVGSNLATIAHLSELGQIGGNTENLTDISRIARESTLSLTEILELVITPHRARKPIADRLREIAGLMLRNHRLEFSASSSPDLDPEQRRNLVFYCKEALHNVMTHAAATEVRIEFEKIGSEVVLDISDNGCGLSEPFSGEGPPLRALRQRTLSLDGTLHCESSPQVGTSLHLRFPINPNRLK